MNWRRVTREQIAEPYAAVWNLEYPNDRRSRDEMFGSYVIIPIDAFEEHWVEEGVATPAIVSAYDLQGKTPVDNLTIDLSMSPENESAGLPFALEMIEEISERADARSVSVWTSDRRPERNAFLVQHGYHLVQTAPVTRLDIQSFDSARFDAKRKAVEDSGIQLLTVDELDTQGIDWVPLLLDATWEMAQDMPRTHDAVQPKLEHYREMLKNETVYKKDLMFVAMNGDRIVGYSRVTPCEAMPEMVRTGLSGVVRDHRRRGIVTALKAMQMAKLRERGYLFAQTDNDVTNPMYRLNIELGFRDVWSWLQFERVRKS